MLRRVPLLLGVVLLAVLLSLPLVPAEHDPDHRYFITGTVTNDAGDAVCGATVRSADITTPNLDANRSATTDWTGQYTIQLHMHGPGVSGESSDEGHQILVTVEETGDSRIVPAEVNTANPEGWGQQTVSFVVSSGAASPGLCVRDVALLGGAILAVIIGLLVAWSVFRRPRARGGSRSLTKVPGVGRARARDLEAAGIRTAEQLAAADPDEIAEQTELTPKQARLLVKRANEYVEKPGS